jgi:hypothetical protein
MGKSSKPKRSDAANRVHDLVHAGECLACEQRIVGRNRRGLCTPCYQLFLRRMAGCGNAEKQAEYEELCISNGHILPPGKLQEMRRDDPFSLAAAAVCRGDS